MNGPISPLEIPLIIELIGSYLSKTDYANCIVVNKTFYRLFKPLLWRKIVKKPDIRKHIFSVSFSTYHSRALIANGQYIRTLEIQDDGLDEILEFLSKRSLICTHLLDFTHTTRHYNSSKEYTNKILTILQNNRYLKQCKISSLGGVNSIWNFDNLFQSLSNHKSLTTLSLMDEFTSMIPCKVYRKLLLNLPPNLMTLELTWLTKKTDDDIIDPSDSDWPESYPFIRNVLLGSPSNQCEEYTVLPFIQRCLELESLAVSGTCFNFMEKLASIANDSKCFSRLDTIHLKWVDSVDWEPVISAFRNRFRTITLWDVISTPTYNFSDSLASSWSNTLEVIRFGDSTVNSSDVVTLLSSCPNLKTFSVSIQNPSTSTARGRNPGLEARYFSSPNWSPDKWVCTKLENLELPIVDRRSYFMEHDALEDDQMMAKQLVKNIYTQLGYLTKLQHLRLGWRLSSHFQKPYDLDFSIESGLGLLMGLSELQVLDVRCIPRHAIRLDELKWMLENWPKLKRVKSRPTPPITTNRDLIEFENVEDYISQREQDNANEQEWIQWLRKQKPHIIAT